MRPFPRHEQGIIRCLPQNLWFSDEEADLVATYLIQHQRALDRVMDKIGVGGRYLVYRPDGKLVDQVDPDALSAAEEKCVDDDPSTADECLEHLGWRFVEKTPQRR
jgi:hypothetical protein